MARHGVLQDEDTLDEFDRSGWVLPRCGDGPPLAQMRMLRVLYVASRSAHRLTVVLPGALARALRSLGWLTP